MNKKLWVFDLDGTLWEENSHVSIVESFLRRKKYSRFLSKVWYKIDKKSFMHSLNRDYDKIPTDFLHSFNPHFVNRTNLLLKDVIAKRDVVIIVTSAPVGIAEYAESIFGVRVFHAEIGEKRKVLKSLYPNYDEVYVVTDNTSDIDLIKESKQTFFRLRKHTINPVLFEFKDKILFFY